MNNFMMFFLLKRNFLKKEIKFFDFLGIRESIPWPKNGLVGATCICIGGGGV